MSASWTGPGPGGRAHVTRSHPELLEAMTVAARATALHPRWDPTRTTGAVDHGRGLLDAAALGLHVLWTYQRAWADEAALATARLPESVWRLLALVGYHPDPGAAAQGLQYLRAKDGVTATLPPGFRVSAPASADLPPVTYETARAVTVRAELNELYPFLLPADPQPATAGAIAAAVQQLSPTPEIVVPGLQSFADALGGRFAAGRAASLAARNAARARQRAQQVADTLAQLRDAGAPDICGDSYQALCAKLCEIAAESAAGPAEPGPLSESQELLAAGIRDMALRQPKALAGLEQALARRDGEDPAGWSARLDQLTGFLDALVGGLLQEARDQVVRLHGSRALTVLDERFAPAAGARGVALPGTDALYLTPTPATPGGWPTTQTELLAPGDWLVVAEDPPPVAPPGTPRLYREAVRVLRVREEVPPGLRERATRITVTPPLRRRYRLDTTVLLGNVVPVSQGVGTQDRIVWRRADGPDLDLTGSPVSWLTSVEPAAVDGRVPQVWVSAAGRDWPRRADLRDAGPVDAVFAVRVDAQGRTRVRVGPGTPDGAALTVRYRVGLGAAGNRATAAVDTIAAAHPGLLDTVNPFPMAGGADPEPADVSRARARGGLHALDRAISLDDVAALAESVAGVARAAVFRDPVRRRDHVTVVAAGAGGHVLDTGELEHLSAYLAGRIPPGASVRVRPHRVVPVRARLRLRIEPGADPLAVLAAVRRRLGAAPADPGHLPGLLDPGRTALGADVHSSDVYAAVGDLPGLASAHLEVLDRADLPAGAGANGPGMAGARDRIEIPDDAVAVWAPATAGIGAGPAGEPVDGLVLAWEEAGER